MYTYFLFNYTYLVGTWKKIGEHIHNKIKEYIYTACDFYSSIFWIATFSSYEKVLVLCEKWLEIFIKSLRFETLRVRKNDFYESVCLSVVGRVRHNSRQNYQIELSFGTLYRSRKSNYKFVNQPHPIKIEGLSTTFVFLKKSKI